MVFNALSKINDFATSSLFGQTGESVHKKKRHTDEDDSSAKKKIELLLFTKQK